MYLYRTHTERGDCMQIEKGIPIPDNATKTGSKKKSQWPVTQMDVGDSFLVEGKTTSDKEYAAIYNVARYHGMRVKGSTVEGGLRVWRVE